MKIKVLIGVVLCSFVLCGYGEAKTSKKQPAADKSKAEKPAAASISWVNTLAEGLALAQSSKKPVMADFYAVWCGWCKKLDKDVYTDPEVAALSKQFVCVKVDTDKYGQESSKYGVQGLPTIIFMNPDGSVIDKVVGYSPAPSFAGSMKKALKK